jgi:hypothetical protein
MAHEFCNVAGGGDRRKGLNPEAVRKVGEEVRGTAVIGSRLTLRVDIRINYLRAGSSRVSDRDVGILPAWLNHIEQTANRVRNLRGNG